MERPPLWHGERRRSPASRRRDGFHQSPATPVNTREEDKMPQGQWTKKRERQYEHIRDGLEERGDSKELAEEIAARTVNKERARAGEARHASSTSTRDISSGRRGGLRSHSGRGGRTGTSSTRKPGGGACREDRKCQRPRWSTPSADRPPAALTSGRPGGVAPATAGLRLTAPGSGLREKSGPDRAARATFSPVTYDNGSPPPPPGQPGSSSGSPDGKKPAPVNSRTIIVVAIIIAVAAIVIALVVTHSNSKSPSTSTTSTTVARTPATRATTTVPPTAPPTTTTSPPTTVPPTTTTTMALTPVT